MHASSNFKVIEKEVAFDSSLSFINNTPTNPSNQSNQSNQSNPNPSSLPRCAPSRPNPKYRPHPLRGVQEKEFEGEVCEVEAVAKKAGCVSV
jgi:hypothetical protein